MRTTRFGPLTNAGAVTFRLWAPNANKVELLLDGAQAMEPVGSGWYQRQVHGANAGTLYQFRIDGELTVPDPASHFQPKDVQGPSEVIDHTYSWRCPEWRGRPWTEAVILELHVGTFTREGTFRAIIDRLDEIAATGVSAVELMPLADFSGSRNWGYDGVLLFAPDSAYGRPEDLKALIDAAHQRGLMVFLDVVYNHFGPEGNYLPRLAPAFFTAHHTTPWGDAIDYRVGEVRAFAVENALHWLEHYRFDGLRLDAVHAIVEAGDPPVLQDLSKAVGKLAEETGRTIHLVLENDDNTASLLDPAQQTPAGRYRAQWNDDYHHAWHVLLTGESGGYYGDYVQNPRSAIIRSLCSGFIYQGERSPHRKGQARGEPSGHLAPTAFVNFLQNHDQIGNRAYGDRLTSLAQAESLEAALCITLLAPAIPLLFMGEEWGTRHPFPFFCDFSGDLADAVRRGRKAEFEAQFSGLSHADEPPDPLTGETYRSAMLDWSEREQKPYAERYALVRNLLAARRRHIVPMLETISGGQAQQSAAEIVHVTWPVDAMRTLNLIANLSNGECAAPLHSEAAEVIWGGAVPERLPPWSVIWFSGRA